MNKEIKEKLRKMSSEDLEKEINKLKVNLVEARYKDSSSAMPPKGTPIKLIRDTKRMIAFIKTLLNQEKNIIARRLK